MMEPKAAARGKAGMTAVLLLLAGMLGGIAVDRLWLMPAVASPVPALTPDAMLAHLDLDPAAAARIRALLDSMHGDITAAAEQGADSLRGAARHAHARLEAALPPHARDEFRAWMNAHHRQMMERAEHAGHRDDDQHGARREH
jgi:hypothetical protein